MSSDGNKLTFDQLELAAPLLKAVKELGYEQPSPIQAEAIPHILRGEDILGQAQTGTGKTAAFALPVLSNIDVGDTSAPQVLVLAPTRELAIQVAEAFQSYSKYLKNFHVLPIYGGSGYDGQLRQLKRGVQVVVGTPGRVMDHIQRKTLKLHNIQTLVLDEADEMLRMGFIEDVEWILENTPEDKQIALFSATMPPVIRKVADQHLREPQIVKIEAATTTNEKIKQTYLPVRGPAKLDALTRILEAKPFDAAIIFVRTKNATEELAEKLEARGYSCAALNGDIVQKQRERTVDRLKKGALDIVIATDVAARGIDVERVTLVVNYDIPYDAEAYTHRIGRTGRAGREGEAILFVTQREQRMLKTIERTTRQEMELMKLPSVDEINDQRIDRFKQRIADAMVAPGIEPFYKLVKEFQEEHSSDPMNVAAALAKLLQGDEPLFLEESSLQYKESSFKERDGRGRRDRDGRGDRPRRERSKAAPEGMVRYRVSVGRNHKVKPGNLVGAIANEGGIESKHIGPIEIYDGFSTVDLPEGMPRDVFETLQKAWVCGQRLSMVPFDGNAGGDKSGGKRGERGDRGRNDRGDRGRSDRNDRDRSRDNRRGDRDDRGRGGKSRKDDFKGKKAGDGKKPKRKSDSQSDRRSESRPDPRMDPTKPMRKPKVRAADQKSKGKPKPKLKLGKKS